jgi:hypothetical protein
MRRVSRRDQVVSAGASRSSNPKAHAPSRRRLLSAQSTNLEACYAQERQGRQAANLDKSFIRPMAFSRSNRKPLPDDPPVAHGDATFL